MRLVKQLLLLSAAGFFLASCTESGEDTVAAASAVDPSLVRQVLTLEQEAQRAADISAINRLQNAYGYYIDRSEWDEVVNLLTNDATAEYGVAGIYEGKENIRALLYGVGYGERGLQPEQLREHMQIQPVITLSADGTTAKARWKGLVILGQYQQYARWQTGPYENEYRKEDGIWKISKLHWKETFTVPFKGGWTTRMEGTNVDDRTFPEPDYPPSLPYEPWPSTSLLPFHFENPVTGTKTYLPATDTGEELSLSELQLRLKRMEQQAQRLEDEHEIETLQRTYGYFVDKNLWTKISDLFAEDGTLEIGGRGIFTGRDRVVEYLEWLGEPVQGRLYDHTQMQGIVSVSEDGQTAKGRWRALVFGGDNGGASIFGDCIYENEYVKVDGVWQISKLHAYFIMYTIWDQGWETMAFPNTRPEVDLPPDLPPTVVYDMYPGELTAPYHYENPVTGPQSGQLGYVLGTEPAQDQTALSARAAAIADRVGAIRDAQKVERLQNIMGYYFDARDWDQVASLFTDSGTMERDQRGVYIGPESIRRGLELFGPAGIQNGNVHENYFYQNITHVDEDGQTAYGRFRTLNMHGDYEGEATLGGGVFENTYIKEDGVWKIQKDHLYTTFLADYHLGWSHGALPVPGISDTIPPDEPPSEEYDIFPVYHTVPFHYDHPVTGEAIFPEE